MPLFKYKTKISKISFSNLTNTIQYRTHHEKSTSRIEWSLHSISTAVITQWNLIRVWSKLWQGRMKNKKSETRDSPKGLRVNVLHFSSLLSESDRLIHRPTRKNEQKLRAINCPIASMNDWIPQSFYISMLTLPIFFP